MAAGRLSTISRPMIDRLRPRYGLMLRVMPGVLVCVAIALATTFVADHYGGPTMLYALLFGMALHFLSEEARFLPGVEFASRTVLRLGVALLGVRITAGQVLGLGPVPVLTVVAAVASTIVAGAVLARLTGLGRDLGLLTGGAVAICGASAAIALAAVMPRHGPGERDLVLTVVGVTTLSTFAMVTYPALAGVLGLDQAQAGVFLGGTIHDVAQAVGAGHIISPETGDIAALVKLMRVAMLVPAVLCFTLLFRRDRGGAREVGATPALPAFLVAFVVLVLANSAGLVPGALAAGLDGLSRWCLVTAVAGLGVKTSLQKLAVVGWRPVAVMVGETLFLLLLVLGAVLSAGVGR